MDKKHVGLLGATSLVGECLQQQFSQNHWHISAFSRQQITQSHSHITWQKLDSTSTNANIHSKKERIVYWVCAAPIWTLPEHFNLLLAYGIKRIIILSSTSRFTKHGSSDRTEQSIAQLLMESENQVQAWADAHQIEWIILRPTLIYGYGRDKNITEITRFIYRFGFFPVFGSAHGLRQPLHADDLSLACYTALNTLNLKNRSYNLTGGETLTYREMVKRIFTALKRSPRLLTVPLWAFKLALSVLGRLPRYQHWTVAMAQRMNQDLVFNCSDAKRDLNFSPALFELATKDLPSKI